MNARNRRVASQERGQATQIKVLEAAAALFARHGFEGTSLPKIAEESGVSTGSIYFHFKSKEQIALGVLNEHHSRAALVVEKTFQAQQHTLDRLVHLSRAMAELILEDQVVLAGIRLTFEEEAFEEVTDPFFEDWISVVADEISRGVESGEIRSRLTPTELAETLVGFFTGTHLLSYIRNRRENLLRSVEQLWLAVIDSIVPPDEVARMVTLVRETFRVHQ